MYTHTSCNIFFDYGIHDFNLSVNPWILITPDTRDFPVYNLFFAMSK